MIEKIILKIITIFTVLALAAMIGLAFLQVILRNFFASGISWADVTVRHLVLWLAFFGAILAAAQERHITLDVFSRVLPERTKKYVQGLIYLSSASVCGLLVHASYKFIISERDMGEMLFAGMPIWWAQVVIPAGFAVIGTVFVIKSVKYMPFILSLSKDRQ